MTEKYSKKNNLSLLNTKTLRSLALSYVGKYATSRRKLSQYLTRKVNERGWEESFPPEIDILVQDFSDLGYVDDAQFAASKARSFVNQGYGIKRFEQDIYANGIENEDSQEALAILNENLWKSADNFARKKRIGPYASQETTPEKKQKQLGAFLRAGHDIKVAKKYIDAQVDEIIEWDDY